MAARGALKANTLSFLTNFRGFLCILMFAQAGRDALAGSGRYSELVALLRARGRHDSALELIRALSEAPTSLPVPPAGE